MSEREKPVIEPMSDDTNAEVEGVWIGLLRAAPPTRRFRLLRSLTVSTVKYARKALREARPGWSDDQLRVEFVRLNHGDQLADRLASWLDARRVGTPP